MYQILVKFFIAVIIILGFVSLCMYILTQVVSPVTPQEKNVWNQACSSEVMNCPDGSVVKRTRPDCSFANCPSEKNTQATDITTSGILECLPLKDSEGPQTMECAFGLKDEKGLYYALNDPEWKFLIGPAMNTSVTVTGTLERKSDTKYNSVGIIKLTNLVKHN